MKISSYYLLLMSEEFFVFYHVYCLCSKYIPCLHSGYLVRDVCINPVNSYGHSKVYKRKFNAQEHTDFRQSFRWTKTTCMHRSSSVFVVTEIILCKVTPACFSMLLSRSYFSLLQAGIMKKIKKKTLKFFIQNFKLFLKFCICGVFIFYTMKRCTV